MWERMSHEIKKVAKETLGESRGFGPRGKESWWWNDCNALFNYLIILLDDMVYVYILCDL